MTIPTELQGLSLFLLALDSTCAHVDSWAKLDRFNSLTNGVITEHNRLVRFAADTAAEDQTRMIAGHLAESLGELAQAMDAKAHLFRHHLMAQGAVRS